MDRRKWTDILAGRSRGWGARAVRAGLRLASWPYAGAMRLRRWAYRAGLVPSRRAAVPVICVGNLTTGGTGKTPMVEWVVALCRRAGRTPAVLTRGYRPAGGGQSDEARLLAERTGAVVVVDPDRLAGAARAVGAGADVLVMDDGFQHLRLRRDLDIVLIDAVEPFGFGRCLPGGLLREPPGALADAGAVVLTHCDEVDAAALERLEALLLRRCPQAALARAVHRPVGLVGPDGAAESVEALAGRPVYAFCGLGAPGHFFASLRAVGIEPAGLRALEDHAAYDQAVLADLCEQAAGRGAEALVTTEKDLVKLRGLRAAMPLWALSVRLEVVAGAEGLIERVARAAGFAPGAAGR